MKKRIILFLAGVFLAVGTALGQSKITGTVISADDGEPVMGASVVVQGTKHATVTNAEGQFSIDVAEGKKLVFSYVGLKTQTLTPKPGMRVVLEAELSLDEVVVTGMQKMDKRLFSGASTKIDAEGTRINGMADISRSLEGRAAGVSVQNVSGTFGTAPKIRVRGATSIYGSSKPLWVVDGVIMEDVSDVSADDLSSGDAETLISSAIAGLNSDDIESFDILKDGSATSIYGAKAMAGVIVVTTKKGKAGQTRINYTGEYTMRAKPSYSQFNIMNSQDQMSVYQELQQKGYLNYTSISNAENSGIYGKMYQLISEYDATSGQFGLANTDEAKAAYLQAAEYRNTNWFDQLFSNSIQHNHSISISTGTDRSQTYISASAMYDPGWTKASKVERYTANMNNLFKVSKQLTLNVISNASWRKQQAPGTLSSSTDAVSGEVKRDFDINPYSYAMNTSRCLDPNEYYTRNYADFNILHELENNYMDLSVLNFRLQGELKYKPIRQLELSVLGSVNHTSTSQEHHILDDSNQAMAYRAMGNSHIRENNSYLYTDPDDPYALPISVLPDGGIYERTDRGMTSQEFRASFNYNDVFAEDHILNVFGGYEATKTDRHSTWFRGWGMQYSMGEIANWVYEMFKKNSEENSDYYSLTNKHNRTVAMFGNVNYSYKGRYSLNGTIRYEGTNRLGKATSARWLPTWNISGAWNIHEEEFMKPIQEILSHAKLRASYSLTADAGPTSVSNSNIVIKSDNPWRPFTDLKESELYISQTQNSELTYEKKHEFDIGLDLGFLNNRINFEGDIFWRNNYDLIAYCTTQGLGGDVSKLGNVASMKSKGIELTLSTTPVKTKDFSWNLNFIYSHSTTEVTDFESTTRLISLVSGTGFTMEGYPVRSLFSIQFMGLNEEGLPTFLDTDGNISTTGVYFQTSDEETLKKTLVYSGPVDPTTTGSFGNTFKYKGLSLNVFITYSFGNVVRLDPVFKKSYSDLTATPKEFNNRWTVPGDENYTTIPVIASRRQNYNDTHLSYAYNAYNYSTERIAKGDFIRMKEISLGYDFPKSLIRHMKLNNLSLKLQATNLFLIYADKKLNGQDPEFFNTGGVAVPVPRQFTLTLKLGL